MLSTLKRISHPLLRQLSKRAFFRNEVSELPERFIEVFSVPVGDVIIRIFGYGAVCRWRAETLLSKEPETIDWIDGFDSAEMFWDVGANIGVYTLYAAIVRQCQVAAFEPAAQNYYILNQNIQLNGIDEEVQAFPVAFSNDLKTSSFHMHSLEGGHALFHMDDDPHRKTLFRQSVIAIGLDEFVDRSAVRFPQHLKIDVDGEEFRILYGSRKTLSDSRLRSVLIELDEQDAEFGSAVDLMREAGFRVSKQGEAEPGGTVRNFIFRRD